MAIYEDAIEAKGMHFSHRIKRWALPPTTGISRLLGDVDERRAEEDDDGVQAPVKKRRPRKSRARDPGTLGEAEEEDLEREEAEQEQEEEEGAEGRKETPRPTQISPAWNTLYGQYMLSSASHHGALCTFYSLPVLYHGSDT